jgi:hypothetical protein
MPEDEGIGEINVYRMVGGTPKPVASAIALVRDDLP